LPARPAATAPRDRTMTASKSARGNSNDAVQLLGTPVWTPPRKGVVRVYARNRRRILRQSAATIIRPPPSN